MSFRNPFRPHGPKKSAISKTAEREFEREVKKIEQLDENVKKVYKDMKRCTESHTAQSKQECKTVVDLNNSPLCREEDQLRETMESWIPAVQKMETLSQELNSTSHRSVTEPMKKFSTMFPAVQSAIKKREQSLQEYNKSQAKMDKYQEKERTGPNIVKLESSKKGLSAAREDYESQNNALMQDMPTLYEGRVDYIEPSFKTLVQAQMNYFTEAHKVYTELSEQLCSGRADGLPQEDYDKRVQQRINEIIALSITADN